MASRNCASDYVIYVRMPYADVPGKQFSDYSHTAKKICETKVPAIASKSTAA